MKDLNVGQFLEKFNIKDKDFWYVRDNDVFSPWVSGAFYKSGRQLFIRHTHFDIINKIINLKNNLSTGKNKPKHIVKFLPEIDASSFQSLRVLCIPDCHIPYQNKKALSSVLKFIPDFKPDVFVIIGDFIDMRPLHKEARIKRSDVEVYPIKKEYEAGYEVLKRIRKLVGPDCKMHYCEGNHENRIYDFIDFIPETKGLVEVCDGLGLEELEISWHPYNTTFNVGKLYFTHGAYCGANAVKKHVEAFKRNLVIGHTHTIASYTDSSPIDVEDKHTCWTIGTLCDMNPKYMENKPNQWVHGFFVANVRGDGKFSAQQITINDGWFNYAGKDYYGDNE